MLLKTSGKTTFYEEAFNFLAEDEPQSLLTLLGAIKPGEAVRIDSLPREIGMAALFPYQPYLIAKGTEERIAHVEAQTEWPIDMSERMTEYSVLLRNWSRARAW